MRVKEAEALWGQLRDAFVNAEKVLIQIIEARAWEPLGYDTFAQAWTDRMQGVRLANACLSRVVYIFQEEGLSDSEVAATVPTTELVSRSLRKQRENKVPASLASLNVKAYQRSLPGRPSRLILEFSEMELADMKSLCDSRGLDLREEALKAIRAHLRNLEKSKALR
jgi:hypothetical protein